MKITATRQRNAVSEGLALGLVMWRRFDLPWNKLRLDFAFAAAWRDWNQRTLFPQVSTDLRNGTDPIWVMTRAGERTHTVNLYWDTGGSDVKIFPRARWSDGEIDYDEAAMTIDGELPADAWRLLADCFLRDFDR